MDLPSGEIRELFEEGSEQRAAEEYEKQTAGEVRFTPRIVENIALTGRGKYKFVIQKIKLDSFGKVSEQA